MQNALQLPNGTTQKEADHVDKGLKPKGRYIIDI